MNLRTNKGHHTEQPIWIGLVTRDPNGTVCSDRDCEGQLRWAGADDETEFDFEATGAKKVRFERLDRPCGRLVAGSVGTRVIQGWNCQANATNRPFVGMCQRTVACGKDGGVRYSPSQVGSSHFAAI